MTKKNKKKPKTFSQIVIDGHVYVETITGKKIEREEIDGNVVLQLIMLALEEGIRLQKKETE